MALNPLLARFGYQSVEEIREEGREEGREQGRGEGVALGQLLALKVVLEARFGPEAVSAAGLTEPLAASIAQLEQALRVAASGGDLQAIRATLVPSPPPER
jgi:flagellar biosynthesis/type III secretory pathway protein FliH